MTTGPWKVCTGPAHPQPTRLPMDEEHWHYHRTGPKAGQPVARCRLCTNWAKLVVKDGPHGTVPAAKLHHLVKELVDRCEGCPECQRRHGLRAETLRLILTREQATVQKKTAQRILQALAEQRREDRRNGTSARFLKARQRQAALEERLTRLAGY